MPLIILQIEQNAFEDETQSWGLVHIQQRALGSESMAFPLFLHFYKNFKGACKFFPALRLKGR